MDNVKTFSAGPQPLPYRGIDRDHLPFPGAGPACLQPPQQSGEGFRRDANGRGHILFGQRAVYCGLQASADRSVREILEKSRVLFRIVSLSIGKARKKWIS
jgi:hypothetical protein